MLLLQLARICHSTHAGVVHSRTNRWLAGYTSPGLICVVLKPPQAMIWECLRHAGGGLDCIRGAMTSSKRPGQSPPDHDDRVRVFDRTMAKSQMEPEVWCCCALPNRVELTKNLTPAPPSPALSRRFTLIRARPPSAARHGIRRARRGCCDGDIRAHFLIGPVGGTLNRVFDNAPRVLKLCKPHFSPFFTTIHRGFSGSFSSRRNR